MTQIDTMSFRLLYLFTDLIAPLIVGYFLHRKHLVTDEGMNRLIKFNVVCVYTVLALLSFWALPVSWHLLAVPAFGFLLVLFPGGVGALFFTKHMRNDLDRGAFLSSAMLSNIGTLGGVCAFILYDEKGFAYSQILGACQNFLLVLIVFPMAQYFYSRHKGIQRQTSRLRTFIDTFLTWNQLSLIGMAIGLALSSFHIVRPPALAPVFQALVHIAAWIAMLPVGFMLNLRKVRAYAHLTMGLTILRFIITPAFIGLLAYYLLDEPVIVGTLLIIAFCPTAINAVLTARLYHLTDGIPVSSFVITTAAYLLFIFPLLFLFLRA